MGLWPGSGRGAVGGREAVRLRRGDAAADVPGAALPGHGRDRVGVGAVDVDGGHHGEARLPGGDDVELVVVDDLGAAADHRVGAVLVDRGADQVVLALLELEAAGEDLLELLVVDEGRDQRVAVVDLAHLVAREDRVAAVGGLLDAGEPEVLEGPGAARGVTQQEDRVPLAVELLVDVEVGDGRGGELGGAVRGHVGLDALAHRLRDEGVQAAGRLDPDDQGAVVALDVDVVLVELDRVDEVEHPVVLGAELVGDLHGLVAVGLVEAEAGDVVGLDLGQALGVFGLGLGETGDGEDEGQGGRTHVVEPLSGNRWERTGT